MVLPGTATPAGWVQVVVQEAAGEADVVAVTMAEEVAAAALPAAEAATRAAVVPEAAVVAVLAVEAALQAAGAVATRRPEVAVATRPPA
jgi:hypothetical protein